MTVLAAPAILAAHTTGLPALPAFSGLPVYEGAAVRRDDVREWVTLGYIAGAAEPTVSVHPVPAPSSNTTRETGTILSQLITTGADVAAARTRMFDLLAAWSGWLTGDRTLGGVLLQGSALTLSADVTLATTRAGATANATVTLTYDATTYG